MTSLQITKRAIDGDDTAPRTVTVTDQADIYAVVAAFDRVRGEFASVTPFACASPVGLVHRYAVTFHWPGHTLIAAAGEPLCERGRQLTFDGVTLPQTLEQGHHVVRSLKVAFDGT